MGQLGGMAPCQSRPLAEEQEARPHPRAGLIPPTPPALAAGPLPLHRAGLQSC
jgi:hypothetical protein